jgi:hypothetical protein
MKSASLAAIATLLVSCLALTTTATASSVDFSNNGGTLSGSSAGLSLSGSTLVVVKGLNGGGLIAGPDLGSVQFTTGALTSGSLSAGGMFASGGTFLITGNGTNGIPNGVLFSATFSGPVTWTRLPPVDGTQQYILSGGVMGTLSGVSNSGFTVQLTVDTGSQGFTGSTTLGSGNTNVSPTTVPEPSSLVLLVAGSLSVLGTMGRKLLVG